MSPEEREAAIGRIIEETGADRATAEHVMDRIVAPFELARQERAAGRNAEATIVTYGGDSAAHNVRCARCGKTGRLLMAPPGRHVGVCPDCAMGAQR